MRIVLVVSDSAGLRDTLTRYLVGREMVAMPTHDAAQALAVCETVLPQALLVDLASPDPDRLALIRHVKGYGAGAALVVVLSDSGDEGAAALCRANGADHLLPKPIDLDALGGILAASATREDRRAAGASPPDAPPASGTSGDGGYC